VTWVTRKNLHLNEKTDNKMKSKIISIVIILILLFATQLIIQISEDSVGVNLSVGLDQTKIEDNDFNKGKLTNLVITPKGDLKLELQTKYIEDDFNNYSKIAYYKNVDVYNDYARLIKINKTFGGRNQDYGYSVQQTSDGGYIIVGETFSYGSVGTYYVNSQESNLWLIKTDPLGNILWNKTFSKSETDYGKSVQQTSDEGYIIVGTTKSNGDGPSDIWLIKTDSKGNKQWDRIFGERCSEFVKSVQQTSDGGYIISGTSFSKKGDIWLIKTDSFGNMQWDKYINSLSGNVPLSAKQTSDGGYILIGTTNDLGTGGYDDQGYPTGDVWLIKTDSSGNEQWNNTFGYFGLYDFGMGVQQTVEGGYIILGITNWSFTRLIKTDSEGNEVWNKSFNGWFNSVQQTSDNGYIITGFDPKSVPDMWVIKTDPMGNEEWNKSFGGYSAEEGYYVQQTNDGGYIVVGYTASFSTGNSADIWLIKTDCNGDINPAGILTSKNLFKEEKYYFINAFNCSVNVPQGTKIDVQFSKNNISWYNSEGQINQWDTFYNGFNSINLSSINWQGSNFHYRMILISENKNIPGIENVNISFSQYCHSGIFISDCIDVNGNIYWKTLDWVGKILEGTEIKFQLRSADNYSELNSENFIGPDGNVSTFYNSSNSKIWLGHNKDKLLQYKVHVESNGAETPMLQEVTIDFNYIPGSPLLIGPLNDTWINYSTPKFKWTFSDLDGHQSGFQILIDNNSDFESVEYNSGFISSTNDFWYFPHPLPDGIWYWKCRTKDNENDWSLYSNNSILKIDTTFPNQIKTILLPKSKWPSYNQPELSFNTTDNTSGIDYFKLKIDQEEFSEQDSPFSFPSLEDGLHVVTVRAYDEANNYIDKYITFNIISENKSIPNSTKNNDSLIIMNKPLYIPFSLIIIIIITLFLITLILIKKKNKMIHLFGRHKDKKRSKS
jgi:hypothetical protein